MSPNAAPKRPLENAEDAPTVKRGRGRPRKDPNNASASPTALASKETNPPKGRGRPRKDTNVQAPQSKDADAPKRGRGRPRKDANGQASPPGIETAPTRGGPAKDAPASSLPKGPDVPRRGRGRPRKDPALSSSANKSTKVAGRGRGRPRKDATAATTPNAVGPSTLTANPTPAKGRPRKAAPEDALLQTAKDDATGEPAKRGRSRPKTEAPSNKTTPATTPSAKPAPKPKADKAGPKLVNLIGTYELTCDEVEENWPDQAGEMVLSISALPHTPSALIAAFDLGILEGTMLLAAEQKMLERLRAEMERGDVETEDNAADDPIITDRSVAFTWRGRNTGDDDTVHVGSCGTQTGILKFTDESCTSFTGVGCFPGLGRECAFKGTRVDDEPEGQPEPWNNFSEAAAEEARQSRW